MAAGAAKITVCPPPCEAGIYIRKKPGFCPSATPMLSQAETGFLMSV
jgi:hypothetical protein